MDSIFMENALASREFDSVLSLIFFLGKQSIFQARVIPAPTEPTHVIREAGFYRGEFEP